MNTNEFFLCDFKSDKRVPLEFVRLTRVPASPQVLSDDRALDGVGIVLRLSSPKEMYDQGVWALVFERRKPCRMRVRLEGVRMIERSRKVFLERQVRSIELEIEIVLSLLASEIPSEITDFPGPLETEQVLEFIHTRAVDQGLLCLYEGAYDELSEEGEANLSRFIQEQAAKRGVKLIYGDPDRKPPPPSPSPP